MAPRENEGTTMKNKHGISNCNHEIKTSVQGIEECTQKEKKRREKRRKKLHYDTNSSVSRRLVLLRLSLFSRNLNSEQESHKHDPKE